MEDGFHSHHVLEARIAVSPGEEDNNARGEGEGAS